MNDVSFVRWRKSSCSGAEGGDCVEVADLSLAIAVRDSKNPHGPLLTVNRPAFRKLVTEIRASRYDL